MKKGFTLIELLAVIVILAIIALIATPIVLNIITDTKESANLRSADFYLDALELSIAQGVLENKNINDGTYSIMNNGNLCLGTLETNTCTGDILEVEVNGETPTSGEIAITSGNISGVDVSLGNDRIVKNSNGELIYFPCTLISGDKNTNGSKYECEVKPGTKYNFYVLSQETNGTTNLIMDRNICEDGTAATENNACSTAWINNNAYLKNGGNQTDLSNWTKLNIYGPVTAMDHVYKATKDWSNVPNMSINYTDQGNTGSYGYGKIVTTDNVTRMTKKDNSPIKVLTNKEGYINLKARLPYFGEVSHYSASANNAYLYDNLALCAGEYYENTCEGRIGVSDGNISHIENIYGYWLLASGGDEYDGIFGESVYNDGWASYDADSSATQDGYFGVRPVINIKL